MWRANKNLSLIIFTISLLNACSAKRQTFETTSPSGKSKVHFELVRRGHSFSFISQGYDGYYSFYYENTPVFENRVFMSDYFKYQSFEEIFPDLRWVTDNILRMGSKEQPTEALHDEVTITNDTEEIVPLVNIRVGSYETFLVTNFQPHQTIQIYVHTQANRDYSGVGATGEWQTGVNVSGYQSFRVLRQQRGVAHYCLSVRNQEIVVRSQEFDGVGLLPDGGETIIPKGCPPR